MTSELPEEGSGTVAMTTNETSSGNVKTTISSTMSNLSSVTNKDSDDDGYFMYIVMGAVAGTVVLIIVIIILCFCLRSRRRRQQNLRIYQERQERPLTLSLDVIDREDHVPEIENGVNNSLYHQRDTILPIVVYEQQREQERSSQQHSSIHLPDSTESITNQIDRKEDKNSQKSRSLQRTDTLAYSASQKETPTPQAATIVYENTNVSNGMFLSAKDKQKQQSMPNLNDDSKFFVGMGRRHNSQKQNRSVKVNGDYETAFPLFRDKESGNKSGNGTNDDNTETCKNSLASHAKNRDTNSSHSDENENQGNAQIRYTSTSSYTDSGSKKLKPEVKPKPKVRRHNNKVNTDIMNGQDLAHHHSSAKMKRDRFKQANDLNTVPPPCNKVTYVNVPESSSNDSTSRNSQHEKSISSPEKKSSHSFSNEKSDSEVFDYVNVPEKKHTNSASAKTRIETSEHMSITGNSNTVSAEMKAGQYVSEKTPIDSGSENSKDMDTREYENVPDKKSSHSKIEETKGSESKDYVNVPDKKSTTSVKKDVLDGKVNAENDDSEKVFKKADEDMTESEELSCYVNIPENISINVIPDDSRRLSSDYEDPGCIESLKKDLTLKEKKTTNERHDHTKKGKLKDLKHTPVSKPFYNKAETRTNYKWLETKLGVPRQTPYAVRGRSISESPANNETDYENKEAVMELQSTMNRKFRRGLSTSTLETSVKYGELRTSQEKAMMQSSSVEDKISDDETYLAMDSEKNEEEDIYLHMESPNDNPYVDMKNPDEEEVYIPMTGNKPKTILSKSKTLQRERSEDIGFATRTCPKPCGGVCSVYNNFSENPPHYANCFRSKSTNNLNEYSYADTKPIVKLF